MQFEDFTASERTKRILALCAELLTLVSLSERQREALTQLSVKAQRLLVEIEQQHPTTLPPKTKKAGKSR